jgi:hypothetical protein
MTGLISRLAIAAVALTGLNTLSMNAQVLRPSGSSTRTPPRVPATTSPGGNTIVMMAPPGPAPSNVVATVNGPTAVTLSWTAAPGATGYFINRSLTASGRNTTLNAQPVVGTQFTDAMLFPRTAAYYSVSANYANAGPGVSTQVTATTPADQPPTGLKGDATVGENRVKLTWNAAPGATGYGIIRDNRVINHEPIRTTSYLDDDVVPGAHAYKVFSYFRDVTGGESEGELHAQPPITVGVPRWRGQYRISVAGVFVRHETWDHALQVDGKRDEIYFSVDVFRVDKKGGTIDTNLVTTRVLGDVNGQNGRVKAGNASADGGIQTGDYVPFMYPWQYDHPGVPATLEADAPPLSLFAGELTRDSNMVIVVPSVWEYDGGTDAFADWTRWLQNTTRTLKNDTTLMKLAGDTAKMVLELADLGLGVALSLSEDGIIGNAMDRPIGLQADGVDAKGKKKYSFKPRAVTIDLARAERELATTVGNKPGVITIPLVDDPKFAGNYDLYLKVERIQ